MLARRLRLRWGRKSLLAGRHFPPAPSQGRIGIATGRRAFPSRLWFVRAHVEAPPGLTSECRSGEMVSHHLRAGVGYGSEAGSGSAATREC
jgi:hypothetical protein